MISLKKVTVNLVIVVIGDYDHRRSIMNVGEDQRDSIKVMFLYCML